MVIVQIMLMQYLFTLICIYRNQLCMNTAIVYMHRFYMFQSMQRFSYKVSCVVYIRWLFWNTNVRKYFLIFITPVVFCFYVCITVKLLWSLAISVLQWNSCGILAISALQWIEFCIVWSDNAHNNGNCNSGYIIWICINNIWKICIFYCFVANGWSIPLSCSQSRGTA